MDVKVGQRVVRGPDWKWGNQDGGEGYVGTIVDVKTVDKPAEGLITARATVVQWDGGSRCNYRCGIDGKYDLCLFDNGPCAISHLNVTCDSCRENNIKGIRWKCVQCYDFDLCTTCYMSGKHSNDHQFTRYDAPNTPGVRVPSRNSCSKILSKGLFKNAEVVRGHDWLWGDQDGGNGNTGEVIEVKDWESDTFRSVAEVKWNKANKQNIYRVGHKGKVDIKCIKPGNGQYYYPSHLAVLGKAAQDSVPEVVSVASGDMVRIQLEVECFKALQEGHGGWNDQMTALISEVGTVHSVLDNGDLRVLFSGGRKWTLNPAVVTKVQQYSVGDVVKVIDDMVKVHDLQENHGGWVDDIALALGQPGRIVKVFPSRDVRVHVNGRTWTLNPLTIHPAPDENPPEASPEDDVPDLDSDMQLKLLSLMESPAVIVAGAASGNLSVIKDFLTKHPFEVDHKAAGKAAIHCATVSGNLEILKCLLEFKANVDIQDEDGDTPLHLCSFGDEDEAAKLLCEHNANVNIKDGRGATALFIAAVKGHVSVLKVLLQQPNIDIHLEDNEGNTPLHAAVLAQRNEVLSLLLDAGADPEKVNFRLFTPIHDAAKVGFLPGIEQFLKRFPASANMPKDDGFTPLHLASLNDHLDVMTALLESKECNINATNNDIQTSLHVAAHQGHGRVVERLVGFGADLNSQDKDGDTPLHMSMMGGSGDGVCDSPQLKKVKEVLSSFTDKPVSNKGLIVCFLIQEGSDPYIVNNKGQTVLSICDTDVAALLTLFIEQKTKSTFHGSLCHSDSPDGVPLVSSQPVTPLAVKAPALSPNKPSPLAKPLIPKVTKLSPVTEPRQAVGASSTSSLPASSAVEPREKPHHQLSEPAVPNYTKATSEEECLLCEKPVSIRLMPCGHVIICKECSQRAKKCPQCRSKVMSIEDIEPEIPKCLMCEEEPALVTVLPCKHQFCQDCCRRMKKCAECKQVIVSKEGLEFNLEMSSTSQGIFTTLTESHGVPLCEICCERPRNTALTCGHQFCFECSEKVDNCPICRKFIQHRIQLFQ